MMAQSCFLSILRNFCEDVLLESGGQTMFTVWHISISASASVPDQNVVTGRTRYNIFACVKFYNWKQPGFISECGLRVAAASLSYLTTIK